MNAARRLPIRWTAAWLWTLCAAAVSAQTQTPQQIAQKAFASTVLVVTENAEGETAGVGSGFFVRSGLIATNRHVISEAAVIRVRLVNQDRLHRIDSVAAQDEKRDLALLRVSSLNAPPLPLGDSDQLQVGETIYAVGNPIGFLEGTFSNGLVSGIRNLPDSKLIQMTAPISEGSSGGPVLNAKGDVIGVSVGVIELGQNLNFAVPSNNLKTMMGRVGRPNLVVPAPRPKTTVPTPRPKPNAAPDRFADYMQWGLPKGAKARIGKGLISEIAFSPDGKTLAVGGSLGIWIYNVQTGRELNLVKVNQGRIHCLAYSPDGRMLASGSFDNTIRICAQTGALFRTLKGHTDRVRSVTFSPDGRTVASGSSDNTIRIWNVQSGALRRTLTGHTDGVNSVTYSPDGQAIASGSSDNTIRIWNAQTGALLHTLTGHTEMVYSVAYSPDGRTIASGSSDNTIRIWNAQTGSHLRTLTGHTSLVLSVTYSPDGQAIASSGLDNTIRIWNAQTGSHLRTLTGHTGLVNSVAYSPDGRVLASSGIDTIRIWNAQTDAIIRTLTGHADMDAMAYSPGGRTFASSGFFESTIRIWNAQTGAPIRTLTGHKSGVSFMAYSPDGLTLASSSRWDNTIRIWNAQTGAPIRTLTGHKSRVSFMAYSPDGLTLASSCWDNTIRIWNAQTGSLLRTLTGHTDDVNNVAYSPDGRTIASGSKDKTIRIWNAQTGSLLRTLTGHTDDVNNVAYSPDGRTIASGSKDKTIRIWNAQTGSLLRTLTGHTSGVNYAAYSLDGQTIACGDDDGTIRIWNARTGALLRMLTGHTGSVNYLAYFPEGRTLASGSADGTTLLWDISNRSELWKDNPTRLDHATQQFSLKMIKASEAAVQAEETGNYEQAFRLYREAIQIRPKNSRAHNDFGGVLMNAAEAQVKPLEEDGKKKELIEVHDLAEYAIDYPHIAFIYIKTTVQAIPSEKSRMFRFEMRKDVRDRVHDQMKIWNKDSIRAIMSSHPIRTENDGATIYSVFLIYGKAASYITSAERHFRRAIELTPEYALAYRNLGAVYMLLQRPAESKLALRQALRLNPNDRELQRYLDNL